MIVTVLVTGTMIGSLGCLGVLARSKPLLTLVISTFTEKYPLNRISLQYTVLILLGFMMEAFIGLVSYVYQVLTSR